MNNEKIKRTLLEALHASGTLIRTSIGKTKNIRKKDELSLVTETDCECERLIMDIIRRDFPDHAFLTEESLAQGRSSSRWIIDPIDGTTNFAHSYPFCCVSIAYEKNGTIETGGIYDPFREELFYAECGKGAFLNEKPIRVSKTPTLSEALLATGFPYDRREKIDEYLAVIKAFIMKVQGIRRSGSAALDFCYVACGRYDGFWEQKLHAWDKAAGMLIVQEAGGKTTNYDGTVLTLDDTHNLATNGLIHQEMLDTLKPFRTVD